MRRTYSPAQATGGGGHVIRLIALILHPYVVVMVAVAVLAYNDLPHNFEWLSWALTALLPAYLFPIAYMRIKGIVVSRRTGTRPGLRSFFRQKPGEMLTLALLFGVPSLLILHFLGSPAVLMQAMGAVTISSVIIALVNRYYRASFHLGVFTTLAAVLALEFHSVLVTGVLILLGLLTASSRYLLREHSPLQILIGILIGLAGAAGAVIIF